MPKGTVPDGLKRYQEARRAGELPPQWSKLTLMEHVNKALRQRNGEKLKELAESIVENAIKGNSACLTFLAERLAPLERGEGAGRTVFEGIKLEVAGSADGQRTSIALVRAASDTNDVGRAYSALQDVKNSIALVAASESHGGDAAQPVDEPRDAEASVASSVSLEESRDSSKQS